mmetsp:Transcript_29837/g.34025  ORF Transcript_29837/g.34025 Transcript_29837/m.34025 type:complete len:80 (+) Transcript_29837:141-380(+)|eukprot:CAMPEP_0194134190 /NCGR_PEP_ID=MMETSP0152-20130528/4276_1 /TAXON_ID=1049557 /ORGANISM="Thalassiothrix antarctica, Strain L6-D1" /LENGTH=79 /DNA_ID=CAMNT_0038829809 /DNA_START=140 /DNA_END=379 /DNA_ORIENTATION=-
MLQKLISRALLPTFERDLKKCIGKELSGMEVDNFLAPQVFGYVQRQKRGPFQGTSAVNAPSRMVKVEYPTPKKQGLFYD